MRRGERGMTLLEVLVALALLAAGGAALLATASAALREERQARTEERAVDAASRVLAATSLLTGADLDRRLGERVVGEFLVRVERPEPGLYRVSVAEVTSPDLELLATVLYQPEASAP